MGREVRIPVYRNGHSKGIAFVDYEDEVSAATALVKADNMMIKNKAIKVALSNPPKRKNEDDSSAPASSSKDVRSLVELMPRTLVPEAREGVSLLSHLAVSLFQPSLLPSWSQ